MEINEKLLLETISYAIVYYITNNKVDVVRLLSDIYGPNSDVPEAIIEHVDAIHGK